MKWWLIALVGLLALGGLSAPRATHADSSSSPTPVLDCITISGSTVTAHWGYTFNSPYAIAIPVGTNNFFSPDPQGRGQTITFLAGTFTDLFTATFDDSTTPALTWTIDGNSATATSTSPYCIQGSAPVNSSAPSVIGIPQVGQTLTAGEGEWLTDCPVTFSNTWQSSLNNGPWAQVGTGATYTPGAADLGAMLRVEVVASNCHGQAAALDAVAVGPITVAPPAIGAALLPLVDCVTDNAQANTLTVQWAYYSAYAQTQTVVLGSNNAVSPTPSSGTPITAFDAGLHHNAWIATLDLTQNQQLVWTLNGATATASVASPECGEASAPVNQTPPTAIGTPAVGKLLTADEGVWIANCTLSFSNSWQRSLNGGPWTTVGTGATYTPAQSDIGALLRVEILASDCHGQAAAIDSATVGPVTAPAQAPANTAAPSISVSKGGFRPGRATTTVSTDGGNWTGSPTPTLTYQWQRCSDSACTDIPSATKKSYNPTDADKGDQLRVVVTASNSAGSAIAVSAETDPINGSDSPSGGDGGR